MPSGPKSSFPAEGAARFTSRHVHLASADPDGESQRLRPRRDAEGRADCAPLPDPDALRSRVEATGCAWQGVVLSRMALDLAARPRRDAALTVFPFAPFGGLLPGPLDGAGALPLWPLLALCALTDPAVILLPARGHLAEAERPAAWVLLAPPSVVAIAAEAAHPGGPLSPVLYGVASLTRLGLLGQLRWLTSAGFTPSWACSTFPSAAFVGASWAMTVRTGSPALETLAVTMISVTVAGLPLHAWTCRRIALAPARGRREERAMG